MIKQKQDNKTVNIEILSLSRKIKEVANKWKDQIDARVYEALMNYQVEITD